MKLLAVFLAMFCLGVGNAGATEPQTESKPTIAAKTAGMERHDGFLPFFWDGLSGKIWLRIDHWEDEFLYVTRLTHGMGSNDVGLDRGRLGSSALVRFRRVGPKVLLEEPHQGYRATSDLPAEQQAVEESFARSIFHESPFRRVAIGVTSALMNRL